MLEPVFILYEPSQQKRKKSQPPPLTEISVGDCSPPCSLSGGTEWYIYSHIHKKDAPDQRIILALKCPLSESPEDYRVTARVGENETQLLPKQCGEITYFCFPQTASKSPSITNRAGFMRLQIFCQEQPAPEIKLIVLPSGFTQEEYQLLLQDLILLHRQLILSDRGGLSVGQWRDRTAELEQQLAQWETILRRIQSAPEMELISTPAKLPFHKVKHIKPRTMVDHALGKQRVQTVCHIPSIDIYEHRVLRTHLERLKKLIRQYAALEAREYSELTAAEISEDKRIHAQEQVDRAHRTVESNMNFPLAFSSLPDLMNISADFLVDHAPSGTPDYDEYRQCGIYHISPSSFRFYAPKPYEHVYQTAVLALFINPGLDEQISFLKHALALIGQQIRDTKRPVWVTFCGKIPRHARTKIIQLTPDGSAARFWFEYIDSVSICSDRNIHLRSLSYKQFLQETFMEKNERYFYSEHLLRLYERREELHRDAQHHRWDALTERIDTLLNTLPVLNQVRPEPGQPRSSNLFRNHPNYRKAYTLIKQSAQQLKEIDLWAEEETVPVDMTWNLYQIWCLVKMLTIFIQDYSFTLHWIKGPRFLLSNGTDGLISILSSYLRHETNLNRTSYHLSKTYEDLKLSLTLHYDEPVKLSANNGTHTAMLQPDYRLQFSLKFPDGTKKDLSFCMDAKYRNYEQMPAAFGEDLFDVAWGKYMVRLKEFNMPTDGSFILHSDSSLPSYFGSHVEEKFHQYPPQKALSCTPKPTDDFCIGSICFTPIAGKKKELISPFRQLIQMIMEHHFKLYQQQCWICGADHPIIRTRYTEGRLEKYHITCRNNDCGEFWVQTHCRYCGSQRKLGKHYRNYYLEKGEWYVECPDCRR